MELVTLGFLGTHRFEKGAAIRGAILITGVETKPLEFRVTAPVRPEKFQEMLYGELLDEHISIELMGLPLLSAVQQKPSLIIVRNTLFLRLNSRQEIPTVLLLAEEEPLIKGYFTKSLNLPDSNRPTVKICTSGQFEPKLEEIAQALQPIFLIRDLMEPFSRLEKACIDVHTRKVGDG